MVGCARRPGQQDEIVASRYGRGMLGNGHFLRSIRHWVLQVAVLVVLVMPRAGQAADVEVCAQEPSNDTVSEALVRVRAELTAAGFSVEPAPCGQMPVDLGRIEFVLQDTRLEITASSLASNSTMIQVADLSNKAITPEVVAVRAVESLRAVLLQSLRSGELKPEAVSPSVREFTQFKSPEEKVEQLPSPVLKPDAPRRTEKPSSPTPPPRSRKKAESPLGLLMSVGPTVEWAASVPSVLAGGEARLIVDYHGASLGVVGQVVGGLGPIDFGQDEGRASAWALLARPGVRLGCGPHWECQVGVLAGYYQVTFAVENPTMERRAARHGTWLVQADVMVGRFFSSGIGILAQVRGGSLINAPVFSNSQDSIELTWGRPLLHAGLSVAYRR